MSGIDMAFLFAIFMAFLGVIAGFALGWTACEFRMTRQRPGAHPPVQPTGAA